MSCPPILRCRHDQPARKPARAQNVQSALMQRRLRCAACMCIVHPSDVWIVPLRPPSPPPSHSRSRTDDWSIVSTGRGDNRDHCVAFPCTRRLAEISGRRFQLIIAIRRKRTTGAVSFSPQKFPLARTDGKLSKLANAAVLIF